MSDLKWRSHAACKTEDAALFFSPANERGLSRHLRNQDALMVCMRCDVMLLCRRYALDNREEHGVWGGLTESDRLGLRLRESSNAE